MKNKIRYFMTTGIIVATLVSSTSMAFAAEAIPSEKKVNFNGTPLESQVMTIDNTDYLPLEAFNHLPTWMLTTDEANKIITIDRNIITLEALTGVSRINQHNILLPEILKEKTFLGAVLIENQNQVYQPIHITYKAETFELGLKPASKLRKNQLYTYKIMFTDGTVVTQNITTVNYEEPDMSLINLEPFTSSVQHKFKSKFMNMSEKYASFQTGYFVDNTGEEYYNSQLYNITVSPYIAKRDYVTFTRNYMINAEYSQLKGTFALSQADKDDDNANGILYIYGDKKLLFTSSEITSGSEPVKVDIPVKGVKELQIVVKNNKEVFAGKSSMNISFGFVEAGLYK